jgi:outer membrane lipopolysaccharide assembly protein LptE/RlpB
MKKTLSIIFFLFLAGCGYSIRTSSDLPFREIRIGSVTNRSTQPNIEDIFAGKLAQEFIRQGIRVVNSSDHVLSAVIRRFSLTVLSVKNEFSQEYEVTITADIRITGPDGSVKSYLSKSSPFMESFVAQTSLNSIITEEQVATDKALADLAYAVVAEIIYQ